MKITKKLVQIKTREARRERRSISPSLSVLGRTRGHARNTTKGRFPLRRIWPRDQAMGYQVMRSSKSKLKASVYWRTRGQFWKLNQIQLLRDQNERKPIRLLLFNARACDRTSSRDQIPALRGRAAVRVQKEEKVLPLTCTTAHLLYRSYN